MNEIAQQKNSTFFSIFEILHKKNQMCTLGLN